jgi:putative hydrolase of HD superfamily
MTRLEEQMKFIIEVDKLKSIVRQNYLCDGSRKEDDADHSWHLALMCVILSEYANEKIDVLKTVTMVLLHDLVEIDAGDTYAYDPASHETKKMREMTAAQRIFNLLPKDQATWLRSLWDEFEEGRTPEAKFAITLDHIQPILLNSESGGKSWREHGVKLSQILKRNETTHEGSEALWEYVKKLIFKNIKTEAIIDDSFPE